MPRKFTYRVLRVDVLESRLALAANIGAHVVEGELIISGDDEINTVRVDVQRLRSGEVRLSPGTNDTINGEPVTTILKGWTGGIRANLRGGDDRVIFERLNIPGSVVITTEDGNDTVVLDRCILQDNLRVNTGVGDDNLHLAQSSVAGTTHLTTGLGHDVIAISRSQFEELFAVYAGSGNDTLLLDSDFQGGITVRPGDGDDRVIRDAPRANFDFRNGAQGWRAGFADYPAGEEDFYELRSGIRQLPQEVPQSGTGFFLSGNNHSDDLFMYLKRRMTQADGIVAGQQYQVRLRVTFASNAPSDCFGIGGSPGNSVFLKAGATTIEPRSIVRDRFVQMNVDKGNQASGGPAATIVSHIANPIPCNAAHGSSGIDEPKYVTVAHTQVHEFLVTASSAGDLWLLVGTDSGYEGTTSLYYQRIEVELIPIEPNAAPAADVPLQPKTEAERRDNTKPTAASSQPASSPQYVATANEIPAKQTRSASKIALHDAIFSSGDLLADNA